MFRKVKTKAKIKFLSNFETIVKSTIYKLINKKNEKIIDKNKRNTSIYRQFIEKMFCSSTKSIFFCVKLS